MRRPDDELIICLEKLTANHPKIAWPAHTESATFSPGRTWMCCGSSVCKRAKPTSKRGRFRHLRLQSASTSRCATGALVQDVWTARWWIIILMPSRTDICGHRTLKAPHPVRSAKLSKVSPSQYCGGGPRGNPRCCSFPFWSFPFVSQRNNDSAIAQPIKVDVDGCHSR